MLPAGKHRVAEVVQAQPAGHLQGKVADHEGQEGQNVLGALSILVVGVHRRADDGCGGKLSRNLQKGSGLRVHERQEAQNVFGALGILVIGVHRGTNDGCRGKLSRDLQEGSPQGSGRLRNIVRALLSVYEMPSGLRSLKKDMHGDQDVQMCIERSSLALISRGQS